MTLIQSENNNNYEEIREKFFSFLLKRPCTEKQAENFLLRFCSSKISEQDINSLINEAELSGLIDDLTFAKLFVEGHLHWGNAKIFYELNSKGISRENINAALEESEDEISRAYELSNSWKKIGISDKKILTRLLSRGFSHKAAREALS